MSKDIILTQTDLNDEGIKTQLNQNDLLEVLVSEVYESHMNKIKDLNAIAKNINEEFYTLKKDLAVKALVKLIHKTGLKVNIEDISFKASFVGNHADEHKIVGNSLSISEYRNESKVQVNSYFSDRFSSQLSINWSFTLQDHKADYIIETTYSGVSTVKVDTKPFEKLKKEAEANVKQVNDFYTAYKDMNLNYTALSREVRVKFNKSLIAKGAPKLRAKIASSFGIELN